MLDKFVLKDLFIINIVDNLTEQSIYELMVSVLVVHQTVPNCGFVSLKQIKPKYEITADDI